MNAHDRSNLNFLRSLSETSLLEWFEQASEDDVLYATELLAAWEQELDAEFYGVAFVQHSNTLQ